MAAFSPQSDRKPEGGVGEDDESVLILFRYLLEFGGCDQENGEEGNAEGFKDEGNDATDAPESRVPVTEDENCEGS